jgi:hypothetical protein
LAALLIVSVHLDVCPNIWRRKLETSEEQLYSGIYPLGRFSPWITDGIPYRDLSYGSYPACYPMVAGNVQNGDECVRILSRERDSALACSRRGVFEICRGCAACPYGCISQLPRSYGAGMRTLANLPHSNFTACIPDCHFGKARRMKQRYCCKHEVE